MEQDQITGNKKHILEFLAVAVNYCNVLEKSETITGKQFLHDISLLLPFLYFKALLLPEIESNEDYDMPEIVSQNDYDRISEIGVLRLQQYNTRMPLPQSKEINIEESHVPLSELLADIYQDCKNFVVNYRLGFQEQMDQAVFHIRQTFFDYWGYRLILVMQAFHQFIADNVDPDQSSNEFNDFDYNKVDTSQWIISQRFKTLDDEF